eukprot:tig00001006_g6230.t1
MLPPSRICLNGQCVLATATPPSATPTPFVSASASATPSSVATPTKAATATPAPTFTAIPTADAAADADAGEGLADAERDALALGLALALGTPTAAPTETASPSATRAHGHHHALRGAHRHADRDGEPLGRALETPTALATLAVRPHRDRDHHRVTHALAEPLGRPPSAPAPSPLLTPPAGDSVRHFDLRGDDHADPICASGLYIPTTAFLCVAASWILPVEIGTPTPTAGGFEISVTSSTDNPTPTAGGFEVISFPQSPSATPAASAISEEVSKAAVGQSPGPEAVGQGAKRLPKSIKEVLEGFFL